MFIRKEKTYYAIACNNWEGYGQDCQASFAIWHDGQSIRLEFHVEEAAVRAVCTEDGQHVWEDSCVEFFFAPGTDGLYYNIECSCTGKLYMAVGSGRNDRQMLPRESYGLVCRRPSLGDRSFGLREGRTSWELSLDIPVSVFVRHDISSLSALGSARGNVYKCGNLLPVRHYLSYAPIGTPAPDFHRPEYFENMTFEP